ncbi:DUF2971 domain-containing protein [Flavobacterium sp. ALJ2]|uniref:DUF2971 domain-containing protein n=1 Tax=Flavobacterium sp. ALJ2 TaxID=2786960 RepID=UPI00189E2CE9|nr:DUF2971 domain-containing protein [Flavobacterium sp. ALJ2]MBF7093417.1 DUF2971 domain-containing protein [Flavobacterium sp. ALJ2]
MEIEIRKFNRFTTLPFLIDMLNSKTLTLLNPNYWEDYNDRETMETYRKKTKAKSIYALCLTCENETIHHWNAFANGTSGCCIEFSPNKLIAILEKENISHKKTEYIRIKDLIKLKISTEQLPYIKRHPFKAENEYRIIVTSEKEQKSIFEIDIDLEIIRHITLSNKMPKKVYESNKIMLLKIAPQLKGKINHSTLYENSNWISHFQK